MSSFSTFGRGLRTLLSSYCRWVSTIVFAPQKHDFLFFDVSCFRLTHGCACVLQSSGKNDARGEIWVYGIVNGVAM